MKKEYRRFWKFTLIAVAAFVLWEAGAGALYRRLLYSARPILESQRTEGYYVAVVFPKITRKQEGYTLTQKEFETVLDGLKGLNYTTLGLKDVHDLHAKHRLVPPRSIFIILDRDDPRSVRLAEQSMSKYRMKGAIALSGRGYRKGARYKRSWLSKHAVEKLKKGGGWDFGAAMSDDGPAEEFAFSTPSGEFRYAISKTGFNDDRQPLRSLNVLRVRGGKPPQEALFAIHSDQPRTGEFVDRFDPKKRDPREWVAGWGAVAATSGRLVLVPTPRHSGAAAFLKGTEGWRDLTLEFALEKYKKGFWAYARYKDADHYVRVGIVDDAWVLQQRTGPLTPPMVLGRVPVKPDSLPAKVRLVVKGDSVLLYINDAMQFGKGFKLDQAVDRGRVQLGVYDKEPRAAIAVLSYVRAKPLGGKWIALNAADLNNANTMDRLREEAIEASVLSPTWLNVGKDGRVSVPEGDRDMVWSLAGYYRLRVLAMADLAAAGVDLSEGKGTKIGAALAEQAQKLEAGGINVVLSPKQAETGGHFLAALASKLRQQEQELYVTVDKGVKEQAWLSSVDGVLTRVKKPATGLEVLEKTASRKPQKITPKTDVVQEARL